jgi:hypothetical protein
MLEKDLSKVWICEYETIDEYGEKIKKWHYKGTAYLNLQQDINELDRKSTGEIDYSILNARTDRVYDIQKGNGISLTDISEAKEINPDYIVTDNPRIGSTTLYKLEKNNAQM